MDTYHLAQRLYWRLLPVPVLGRHLRATVDGVKASLRKVAAPTLDSVTETLQVHSIALAGLRDALAGLREDVSQQSRQFLGVAEGLREALASERHSREESVTRLGEGAVRQAEEGRGRLGELR